MSDMPRSLIEDYVVRFAHQVDDPHELRLMLVALAEFTSRPFPVILPESFILRKMARGGGGTQIAHLGAFAALKKAVLRGSLIQINAGREAHYAPWDENTKSLIERCKRADLYFPLRRPSDGQIASCACRSGTQDDGVEWQALMRYFNELVGAEHVTYLLTSGEVSSWLELLVEASLALSSFQKIEEGWELPSVEDAFSACARRLDEASVEELDPQIREMFGACPDVSRWHVAIEQSRSWTEARDQIWAEESADPLLCWVIDQYRTRVNRYVDPVVKKQIEQLCRTYRNREEWLYAFNQAALSNAKNIRYITAVLRGQSKSTFTRRP